MSWSDAYQACRSSCSPWAFTAVIKWLTESFPKRLINYNPCPATIKRYASLTVSSLFDQIIIQLSHVLTLKTSPELHSRLWHVDAWNLYRSAIVLFKGVSVHPHIPKDDKMWRILDHIFLQTPGSTPDEKLIVILSQARERLSVYSRLKKMRVPANLVLRANYPFPSTLWGCWNVSFVEWPWEWIGTTF